jgi:hypothetical protein
MPRRPSCKRIIGDQRDVLYRNNGNSIVSIPKLELPRVRGRHPITQCGDDMVAALIRREAVGRRRGGSRVSLGTGYRRCSSGQHHHGQADSAKKCGNMRIPEPLCCLPATAGSLAYADFRRGVVAEARVGSRLVVLSPALLDQNSGLLRGVSRAPSSPDFSPVHAQEALLAVI